ncbi:MAG: DUF1599 domain-containing protein [Bacteroidales bacterium]
MHKTLEQYDQAVNECREVFISKLKDYGPSWRILRPSSLTDQIFIKARRIRSVETLGKSKINEGIKPEYIGIYNYSLMALIQLELGPEPENSAPQADLMQLYNQKAAQARALMENKNHDYGEAWREMRLSSLTDIILMKIQRIKQIEDNEGITIVSEGLDANYLDIMNYAVFALIKINEGDGK